MNSSTLKIRVLVNDDHELFKCGMVQAVTNSDEFELLAALPVQQDWTALINRYRPNVIITTIGIKYPSIVEEIERLSVKNPEIGVLVVSMFQEERRIIRAIRAGARGCILRSATKDELFEAIRAVHKMQYYYSSGIAIKLGNLIANKEFIQYNLPAPVRLTPEDKLLIRLMCSEYSVKEIAAELGVTLKSIESKKSRLYEKIGKTSIVGLMNYAFINGLYNPYERRY